ncbi:hypothetical protein [Pseudomonas sp. BF-B-26]|jgi:hypothetical protein|uniref:hypothetical protein n=1 Tax=Pseudomonas sp. BF-B-26 TaxID=2832400 RepID=UPI001CBD8A3F|nr:hypothetical protein [Pseudomonas sp. BF-B-26]
MPEIKERPILFSAPMVRAILEGRKTVTRRPVKGGQIPTEDPAEEGRHRWSAIAQRDPRYGFCVFGSTEAECAKELAEFALCPYGKPGERLWVRETTAEDCRGSISTATYTADGAPSNLEWWYSRRSCPSIHMPRVACRILLEITAVRVERLQDISRSDIRAEGLECPPELASDDVSPNYRDWYPAAWRELWESTGGNWDANPWVWVVEFKQVTP